MKEKHVLKIGYDEYPVPTDMPFEDLMAGIKFLRLLLPRGKVIALTFELEDAEEAKEETGDPMRTPKDEGDEDGR
jgi:hypothetical protein